jgi:hypothetical protein
MNEIAIPGTPDEVVRVFVSYAREDRKWLEADSRHSLIPFLMDSLRRHNVAFWFDKELKPGDEFRRYIESEIDQSQIALLIVSQSFLNSEFIEGKEMPRIAERARLGKMIVVPVLVEPCDWSEYPFLADRQMVPSSPLIEYTDNDAQWAKIRFQILDGLKAQVKRIREALHPHVSAAAAQNAHDAPHEVAPGPAPVVPDFKDGAVFLSCASADRATARSIRTQLEANHIDTWMDDGEIAAEPGDGHQQAIRENIRCASSFVPIISRTLDRAGQTPQFVWREWHIAEGVAAERRREDRYLQPLVIDDTPQAADFVGLPFRDLVWTRLRNGQIPPEFIETLSRRLRDYRNR